MAANLEGMAELTRRLNELGTQLAAKELKKALRVSVGPVEKKMKMQVPVGNQLHRTYKGRLVVPGNLRRSIRRISGIKDGKAFAIIGVRREAFYGVHFIDKGYTLKLRSGKVGKRTRKEMRNTTYKTKQIPANKWFEQSFIEGEQIMLETFKEQLLGRIERAIRR